MNTRVNTSTLELLSNWAENASLSDLLVVYNGLDGHTGFHVHDVLQLDVGDSLSRDDQWGPVRDVDRQTRLCGDDGVVSVHINDLHELIGVSLLHTKSLNTLNSDLLKELLDHPAVNREDPLETQCLDSDVSLRLPHSPALHVDNVL